MIRLGLSDPETAIIVRRRVRVTSWNPFASRVRPRERVDSLRSPAIRRHLKRGVPHAYVP